MIDLHILKRTEAERWIPEKPTYAIQIHSSWLARRNDTAKLISSPHYRTVVEYTFDDVTPKGRKDGEILFTPAMATELLTDFDRGKDSIDALLVHCSLGENRSPAVAMALNKVFGLGHDHAKLSKQYPDARWFVYATICEAAGVEPDLHWREVETYATVPVEARESFRRTWINRYLGRE